MPWELPDAEQGIPVAAMRLHTYIIISLVFLRTGGSTHYSPDNPGKLQEHLWRVIRKHGDWRQGGSRPPHGDKRKKARPRGARPKHKINYKVMEKKFIQKSDLGEIMECLAERAVKNADKVSLEICVEKLVDDVELVVKVRDKNTWDTAVVNRYVIIERIHDDLDISEDTFDAAFDVIKAKKEAERKAQEEAAAAVSEDNN